MDIEYRGLGELSIPVYLAGEKAVFQKGVTVVGSSEQCRANNCSPEIR